MTRDVWLLLHKQTMHPYRGGGVNPPQNIPLHQYSETPRARTIKYWRQHQFSHHWSRNRLCGQWRRRKWKPRTLSPFLILSFLSFYFLLCDSSFAILFVSVMFCFILWLSDFYPSFVLSHDVISVMIVQVLLRAYWPWWWLSHPLTLKIIFLTSCNILLILQLFLYFVTFFTKNSQTTCYIFYITVQK